MPDCCLVACHVCLSHPPATSACLPACLQALRSMGVQEPFSDRAQFGKLSPMSLMIDDIYHSVSV
jgi:serine protease inhibitor